MNNIRIVIYKNRPIYTSLNGTVDFYLVIKSLCNILTNDGSLIGRLTEKDFEEYQSKNTIKEDSINSWIRGYGIEIWKWNQVINDYVQTID